jgi:hypothetical protein
MNPEVALIKSKRYSASMLRSFGSANVYWFAEVETTGVIVSYRMLAGCARSRRRRKLDGSVMTYWDVSGDVPSLS